MFDQLGIFSEISEVKQGEQGQNELLEVFGPAVIVTVSWPAYSYEQDDYSVSCFLDFQASLNSAHQPALSSISNLVSSSVSFYQIPFIVR